MRRRVKLLGEPAIFDPGGRRCEVRGQQAWAVLARILLSRQPLDRRQLSAELFPEAADPLGALRWCLAALRRALDDATVLRGDPIEPGLPPSIIFDIGELEAGSGAPEEMGELLSGIDPRAGIAFSTWLLVERQRISVLIDERLRGACLSALSRGDWAAAIRAAEAGVRRDPFNESMHVLLVKSLSAAGHGAAALAHVEAAERSFRAELGVEPAPALRSAARRTVIAPVPGVPPRAHARSLLAAGKAALSAGAADAGVETLRRAVHEAEGIDETALIGEAMLELGTALVHAVRGHDDEGAVLLHKACALARDAGAPQMRAAALRELGYLEALAGRRPTAAACLDEALGLTADPDRVAGIHSVIGFNLVDWGRIGDGIASYQIALDLARSTGSRRREAWCLGIGARGLIAADDCETARAWLEQCMGVVEEMRWVAFRPWVLALRGETLLKLGHKPAELRQDLEYAFALSCELHDPCWEGATSRAIAHTYLAEGALEEAQHWFGEALVRTCRDANVFAAQQVDILEDRTRLLRRAGRHEEARTAAQDWLTLAARTHMDGSVRRAAQFITTEA